MCLHLGDRSKAHVLSAVWNINLFATFTFHKINFKNAWNLTVLKFCFLYWFWLTFKNKRKFNASLFLRCYIVIIRYRNISIMQSLYWAVVPKAYFSYGHPVLCDMKILCTMRSTPGKAVAQNQLVSSTQK